MHTSVCRSSISQATWISPTGLPSHVPTAVLLSTRTLYSMLRQRLAEASGLGTQGSCSICWRVVTLGQARLPGPQRHAQRVPALAEESSLF